MYGERAGHHDVHHAQAAEVAGDVERGDYPQLGESAREPSVKVVIENKRPVPLHFFFQCQNHIVDHLDDIRRLKRHQPNKIGALIRYIRQQNGLPCIYFVFGRKRAEYLASELYNQNFLDKVEQAEILSLYDSLCERFDLKGEASAVDMTPLVERGIAFHHAGMLPTLKEVIERLFTSRLLKVIFTTETFALGINMPSRSVIFDELRKFYGTYTRNLKTRDFYQMAGRAGRRGIDNEGFVYSRINPGRIKLEEVRRIIYGAPEDVRSQLNASYATILNLYEKYKEGLFNIYPLSLHYFQAGKNQKAEMMRLMEAKLKLLKELAYVSAGALTAKGKFAKAVYGYELLLAELYAEGAFEGLDETALAVMAAAVVFEPRKSQRPPGLSKNSEQMKKTCERVYDMTRHKESRYGIYPYSKSPHFNLAKATECWIGGMKFSKLLQFTDTDEGELIRYFRMAVQILREIKDAPISPTLAARITRTMRLLNRDIVDAEKQLRES